jgi:hypothetical protein
LPYYPTYATYKYGNDGLLTSDILFDCAKRNGGGIEVNVLMFNHRDLIAVNIFDATNKMIMTQPTIAAGKRAIYSLSKAS